MNLIKKYWIVIVIIFANAKNFVLISEKQFNYVSFFIFILGGLFFLG